MIDEQRILELLEIILDTDCEPAVACANSPELLPKVRERLNDVRRIEQQIKVLFPESDPIAEMDARAALLVSNRMPTVSGHDVVDILGSGGMGVVYRARHRSLNRIVAIKMLRAGPFASPPELTRFAREFQAIAELQHPYIVQIYEVGNSDGRPFFTMEYLEGGSLADQLLGVPQSARQAAQLVSLLAEAIQSAHHKGIIHRDLKPANILLTRDGTPKIGDFGLARHVDAVQALTLSGTPLGTPSYMAPEQALGAVNSIGTSVDIYSLGAILYEMLTGRPPFRAASAIETQRQVISVEVVAPTRVNASVPRDLETICLTCLNKIPQRRYPSASELAADLQRFLRNEPIHARPVSRLERMLRMLRRKPSLTALIITAIAFVCLATALAFREYAAAGRQRAELEKWTERLAFVNGLEKEARFTEARVILGRLPDGGSRALREQIGRAQTDLDLVERLDVIRLSRGRFFNGGGFDYDESSRAYQLAFRDAGLGKPFDDPQSVAQRIRTATVHAALVAALDDWAACAMAEPRAWILEVARRADPDPWRDRVRDQESWANLEHLTELSLIADVERQPITLMVAMGTRWRRLGGDPSSFLKRVHRYYANDFWLNFELAVLHSPHAPAAALGYNRAALAIRPDATSVHYNMGVNLERLGQLDEAIFHYQRVLATDPQHTWAEHRLASVLLGNNQFEESLERFQRALQIDSANIQAKNGMRLALLQLGRLEEARRLWESILQEAPAPHEDIDGYAELCLYLGYEDQYHAICETMLKRFGSTNDPLVCERIGRACLLKPRSDQIRREATELIDLALGTQLTDEQLWAAPYLQLAKAFADYRQGRIEEALAGLKGEAATVLQPLPNLLLAMTLHSHGDEAEAQQVLTQAMTSVKQLGEPSNREMWLNEILLREAENLLAPPPRPDAPMETNPQAGGIIFGPANHSAAEETSHIQSGLFVRAQPLP